jgi:hypothetical protein
MIPKLGDRYAIVASHSVHGPFYVIGVRGSLVALGTTSTPEPKTARPWRAHASATNMHRNGESWPVDHAEPWTIEHAKKAKRQKTIRYLATKLNEILLEQWTDDQLKALVDVIAAREVLLPVDASKEKL